MLYYAYVGDADTYACYDKAYKNLAVVIRLSPNHPEIADLYGGKKLLTDITNDIAYEVYQRDRSWSSGQFFDVIEFDKSK